MSTEEILDDQISCSTEDFDLDILSEIYSEILSEIKTLRKKAKFSENFSARKFDLMSAARFGNSIEFLEGVEKEKPRAFEPINFPKLKPFMLPNLIYEENNQFYARDSGNSRLFASNGQGIAVDRKGEFSLFKNLFSLVPDLQNQSRKANLVEIQKALKNEKFFVEPVSDAVSL